MYRKIPIIPVARRSVYTNKVLALNPIAYWPLSDGGSVVVDESGHGLHGVYSNTTLDQASVSQPVMINDRLVPLSDGRTSASFNGSTSYANIYSAALNSAFNGQLFTISAFLRVNDWTSGTQRLLLRFRVDGSNDFYFDRFGAGNLRANYAAQGVALKTVNLASQGFSGWYHVAAVIDKANDQFSYYVNGALVSTVQTGLGTWTGSLSSTQTLIGGGALPGNVWDGSIAHVALFNTALTPTQIFNLSSLTTAYDNTYLLKETFSNPYNKVAPLVGVRQAEPGPGQLQITESSTALSIANGSLIGSTTANQDGFASIASYARAAGRAVVSMSTLVGRVMKLGWMTAASSERLMLFEDVNSTIGGVTTSGTDISSAAGSLYTPAVGSSVLKAVVLRSTGAFFFYNGKLVWVDAAESNTPLKMRSRIVFTPNTSSWQDVQITDLPSPLNTDYGIATDRKASPSAGDTLTMAADALVEFTWTAVTGQTLNIYIRRTDDNNAWIIRGDQAGSTIKLIEIVAGVETERNSASQTWTNATAYRIVILAESTTIRTYVANVAKNNYTSASTNQSATGAKVDKAGTEFISWPRNYDISSAVASGTQLLYDQFNDVQEPGFGLLRYSDVGKLQIIDTNSIMSVSNGQLVINGTAAVGDRIVSPVAYARKNGRAFLVSAPSRTSVGSNVTRIGFDATNTSGATGIDIGFDYSTATAVRVKSGVGIVYIPTIGSNQHDYAFIMRSVGGFFLARNGATGAYTLYWVYNTISTAEYAKIFNTGSASQNLTIDDFRVTDFTDSAWLTDYGIATARNATPSDGSTLVGTADGIFEITFTYVTSATPSLMFRRVDDNNCWIIRIPAAGTTIELVEKNAGVETVRGTGTFTFSNGVSYRLAVIADSTSLIAIVGASSAEPTISSNATYSTATFNQTSTGIKWNASTTTSNANLVAWPRTLTLPTV